MEHNLNTVEHKIMTVVATECNSKKNICTKNNSDDMLVFPRDFIVLSEDIPILDGIREGKGSVIYQHKEHADWPVFILNGEWYDNEPEGNVVLIHNSKIIMKANYRNKSLYLRGHYSPNGIIISSNGCSVFPFSKKDPSISNHKSSIVTTILPNKRQNISYPNESTSVETSAELISEENDDENDSVENSEYEAEDMSDYGDDVYLLLPDTKKSKFNESNVQAIVKSILTNHGNSCLFYSFTSPRSHKVTWFAQYQMNTANYLIIAPINSNKPHGKGFVYITSPMKLIAEVIFELGVVKRCIINKNTVESEQMILDLSNDGDRWEGEVRNMKPNGYGQFFDMNNTLIYEGHMIGGYANGFGVSYDDNGNISFDGMWSNGRRHGYGREYNRKGSLFRSGIWIDNEYKEMMTSPRKMVTNGKYDEISLTQYSPLANVIYLNSSTHQKHPINIEGFPYLKSVFIDGQCLNCSTISFDDLPSLTKVVCGDSKGKSCPILVSSCPALHEIWCDVNLRKGWISVEKPDGKARNMYDQFDRVFEDRFIMQELSMYLKWIPLNQCDNESEDEDSYILDDYCSFFQQQSFMEPYFAPLGKFYVNCQHNCYWRKGSLSAVMCMPETNRYRDINNLKDYLYGCVTYSGYLS